MPHIDIIKPFYVPTFLDIELIYIEHMLCDKHGAMGSPNARATISFPTYRWGNCGKLAGENWSHLSLKYSLLSSNLILCLQQ